MPNCTFHIVDAFTAVPFTGNPCAVVTDADGIEPADMLRIARETNAPETAFVLASDKADVRVRYFMPRGEIPFAGHPTIATGHLLRELGAVKPGTARSSSPSACCRGHPPRQGDHDPAPRRPGHVRRRRDNGPSARASGFRSPGRASVPAHAGGRQLPDGSRPGACRRSRRINMDRPALKAVLAPLGVSAAYVFAPEGVEPETDVHARLIDPDNAGEDPFTGSAARVHGFLHARARAVFRDAHPA